MTEWERLQQGLIYNDFDEELPQRNYLKHIIRPMMMRENCVIKFYSSYLSRLEKMFG